MEEGINNSGNDLFIAMSLQIGSLCDVVWPLGWALENKCKSPNSAFFSEADIFQLLTVPPQPPCNRGAAPNSLSSAWSSPSPGRSQWEMNYSSFTATAICLMQSRQLSAANLIEFTKDLCKLLILDGGPKGKGSQSCLESSLPLKHFPPFFKGQN